MDLHRRNLLGAVADLDEHGAAHDERAAKCFLYLGVVQARQDEFEEAAASLGRAITIFEQVRLYVLQADAVVESLRRGRRPLLLVETVG